MILLRILGLLVFGSWGLWCVLDSGFAARVGVFGPVQIFNFGFGCVLLALAALCVLPARSQ